MRRLLASACLVAALALPEVAAGHIMHPDGSWTYRYLSRESPASNCASGSTGSDPLNVLFWQYGEGSRIDSHLEAETHWGFYPSWVPRDNQYICGDSDGAPGNYTVNDQLNFDDQEGHGSYLNAVRAHFRIWYSPHGHGSVIDKWSTIDVHHEKVALCTCVHKIDEDWETWENHISSEMAVAHNRYYDYWIRQGAQYLQGFYDDGAITRVGGLHNGAYP